MQREGEEKQSKAWQRQGRAGQRQAMRRKAKAKNGLATIGKGNEMWGNDLLRRAKQRQRTDLFGGIGQTEFLADFSELYPIVDKCIDRAQKMRPKRNERACRGIRKGVEYLYRNRR